MNDAWDPAQYARFREERQQPFYDLLRLVIAKKGMRVVDLGCGTGELTRELHRQLKALSTLGIDSSEAMLKQSAELSSGAQVEQGLTFSLGRIEALDATEAYDLVLSNAAIHWVPDHPLVLARLTRALAPGGQLALQMPANRDSVEHTTCDELMREEPFASRLASDGGQTGVRQHTLGVEQYSRLLWSLGFRQQHVRLQAYPHKMASREGVLEWVKGALLTDARRRMDDALWTRFLETYRERLFERLPDDRPYLYVMKRLFLWGEK